MIALSIMYIPNCMIFYFCITWLPSYLLERHGFNTMNSIGNLIAMLNPLIVAVLGLLVRQLGSAVVWEGGTLSCRRGLLGARRPLAAGVRRGVNVNQGDCRGTTWNPEGHVRGLGRSL